MAVTIKSPREIELMRKAGEILAQVHEELHAHDGHRQAGRAPDPQPWMHSVL